MGNVHAVFGSATKISWLLLRTTGDWNQSAGLGALCESGAAVRKFIPPRSLFGQSARSRHRVGRMDLKRPNRSRSHERGRYSHEPARRGSVPPVGEPRNPGDELSSAAAPFDGSAAASPELFGHDIPARYPTATICCICSDYHWRCGVSLDQHWR